MVLFCLFDKRNQFFFRMARIHAEELVVIRKSFKGHVFPSCSLLDKCLTLNPTKNRLMLALQSRQKKLGQTWLYGSPIRVYMPLRMLVAVYCAYVHSFATIKAHYENCIPNCYILNFYEIEFSSKNHDYYTQYSMSCPLQASLYIYLMFLCKNQAWYAKRLGFFSTCHKASSLTWV